MIIFGRAVFMFSVLPATFLLLAAASTLLRSVPVLQDESAPESSASFSVLVFTKTAGFRHDSIPAGIDAIRKLGEENRFKVDQAEDPSFFNDEKLAEYDVVIFLNTTDDVLNEDQQRAFETFIRGGGGYVGVHAAADCEYNWKWYGGLVGAYFSGHPRVQPARIDVENRDHPSTRHLSSTWMRTDEWYNYKSNPREMNDITILLSLDESSYEGGTMNGDHPIAWCREYEGGRAFYTGGGHTSESYFEPDFLKHLLGGIQWAAGAERSKRD